MPCPQKIFRKYGHFALWEAFCQTNRVIRLKSNILAPQFPTPISPKKFSGWLRHWIDTRVGISNAVLCDLYRSVAKKQELSNTAKLSVFKSVFVLILTCGQESWEMTERVLTQVQVPKMGSLRRLDVVAKGCTEVRLRPGQETSLAPPCLNIRSFGSKCTVLKKTLATLLGLSEHSSDTGPGGLCPPCPLITRLVWHLETKCAAVKFAEPWMSKHFSELREHNYTSWSMYLECHTKLWWGKSC